MLDDGRLLGIDALVLSRRREPDAHARLLERRLRLIDPQLEVILIELADHLAAFHARAEVDRDLREAAGDFRAEHDLIVGRERAGRGHRSRDRALGRGRHLDLARRRPRRLGLGFLGSHGGPVLTTAQQQGETNEERSQSKPRHLSDDTAPDSPARPEQRLRATWTMRPARP